MPKKKAVKKDVVKDSKPDSPTEVLRKKIVKWVFWGSWAAWFVILLPMYWPNNCAAFYDFLLNGAFECPKISLFISLILGSLFMAFLTWLVGWIGTWLYFYHDKLTWENIKKFFKD